MRNPAGPESMFEMLVHLSLSLSVSIALCPKVFNVILLSRKMLSIFSVTTDFENK